MEEGGQPEDHGRMHCAIAALATSMMAGMKQLPLHMGVVHHRAVTERSASPQAFVKLVIFRVLQRKLLSVLSAFLKDKGFAALYY